MVGVFLHAGSFDRYAVLISVAALVYLFPSIIAFILQPPNSMSVFVVNLFLGWSVVGWVVALAMAVRSSPVAVQNSVNVDIRSLPESVGSPASSSELIVPTLDAFLRDREM